jgi:hypothetical protein
VLACAVTLTNQLSLILTAEIASLLMPLNGLLWLIWWLLVSRGLFKLGRNTL